MIIPNRTTMATPVTPGGSAGVEALEGELEVGMESLVTPQREKN
jgi:hypothetical protein